MTGSTPNPIESWVVIAGPEEHPDSFTAQKYLISDVQIIRAPDLLIAPSLEALRSKMPAGLKSLPRLPGDAPGIVENWVQVEV